MLCLIDHKTGYVMKTKKAAQQNFSRMVRSTPKGTKGWVVPWGKNRKVLMVPSETF